MDRKKGILAGSSVKRSTLTVLTSQGSCLSSKHVSSTRQRPCIPGAIGRKLPVLNFKRPLMEAWKWRESKWETMPTTGVMPSSIWTVKTAEHAR